MMSLYGLRLGGNAIFCPSFASIARYQGLGLECPRRRAESENTGASLNVKHRRTLTQRNKRHQCKSVSMELFDDEAVSLASTLSCLLFLVVVVFFFLFFFFSFFVFSF